MKSDMIRVCVFDQIVSGGGGRFFTVKLLEEWSRQADAEWRFRLMWPLFDSSNKLLSVPKLKNVEFERITLDAESRRRERKLMALSRIAQSRKLLGLSQGLAERRKKYEAKVCLDEQRKLRLGDGRGLAWLDERIDEFDLIYLPYPYLTLPGAENWRPRKPLVITLHDLAHEQTDAWGDLTENLQREMRRWTQLADMVIFSSDFVMKEAQKIYGLPEQRATRIYLSPPEVKNNAMNVSLPDQFGVNKKYILTLGWAAPHKGVETIIEGFAIFKKRSQVDVALVCAGPNTESLLLKDTFGLRFGQDLFALGFVGEKEIPALYLNAEAVVTASLSEAGFNAMIFDAMNYERPVICSNIPQFTERLGDDDCDDCDDSLALTFDPFSPEALADAFERHFENPARAKWRARNAKKFIDSRQLADVGKDYLAAFKSVVAKAA